MGTGWSVKLVTAQADALEEVRAGIEQVLARIVVQMSHWEHGSDIRAFNRAHAGAWYGLPHDFYRVLECALAVARDTDGAYDPTVGRLAALWGFGPQGVRGRVPSASEIAAAKAQTGWSRVLLDPAHKSARQPGGVSLDLSSIAKGYAVDKVCDVLRGKGIYSFLVEIGGELRGEGVKPDGLPWWVKLEQPGAQTVGASGEVVVALSGLAVATSGSSEHYFDADGRRFSHTIDPRTGWPIAHDLVSVTVLHSSCMRADVLATALTVLGPDEGMAHALRTGLAARFVSNGPHGPSERLTPRFAAMLG